MGSEDGDRGEGGKRKYSSHQSGLSSISPTIPHLAYL
jgi:hypothetical protein